MGRDAHFRALLLCLRVSFLSFRVTGKISRRIAARIRRACSHRTSRRRRADYCYCERRKICRFACETGTGRSAERKFLARAIRRDRTTNAIATYMIKCLKLHARARICSLLWTLTFPVASFFAFVLYVLSRAFLLFASSYSPSSSSTFFCALR